MSLTRNLLLLSCTVLFAASCGGSTQPLEASSPDVPGPGDLKVYDASFLGEPSEASFSVRSSSHGDYVDSVVSVERASDLRALCLELQFDPSELTPVSVARSTALDRLMQDGQLIEIERLDYPGTVHYAHMQLAGEQGFSGSGDLLSVRFLRRAMATERQASAPPNAQHSVAELSGSILSGELAWYYRNRGDYDQNGEVNVADITPLGVKLGSVNEVPGESFDIASVNWQVDGDENGNINISDITPLGANLGTSASGGYKVYTSDLEADYPDSENGFKNGAGSTLVASIGGTPPLSEAANFATKSTEHLRFNWTLPDPLPGKYYWVRPNDGKTDGIPSTLVGPLSLENIPEPVIEAVDKLEVIVGEQITITGTGFGIKDAEDQVLLNDLPLGIVTWTNTTIVGTIPAGAADGSLIVQTLRSSEPSDPINVIPPTPGQPDGSTV